jgi:hypothetical protein
VFVEVAAYLRGPLRLHVQKSIKEEEMEREAGLEPVTLSLGS